MPTSSHDTDTQEFGLLNREQAAAKLDLSPDTFTRILEDGKAFPHEHFGAQLRIPKILVDKHQKYGMRKLFQDGDWDNKPCEECLNNKRIKLDKKRKKQAEASPNYQVVEALLNT